MTKDKGYGHTNCQYCGASLKGGHECQRAPHMAQPEELATPYPPQPSFQNVNYATWADRRDRLLEGRNVPASYVEERKPDPTDYWETWWGDVAPWGTSTDGGYKKMPDDWTPSMTEGLAVSGKRHTHRAKYTADDGFQIQMPSVASVRRYAAEEAGPNTFEIPVSVVNEKGREAFVSALVTWHGPGNWTVQTPAGDDRFGRVSESVACVLEARRPSVALKQAGDLGVARRERQRKQGVPLTPSAQDSFINSTARLPGGGVVVNMENQRMYTYAEPEEDADGLVRRLSGQGVDRPGVVYNREVKNRLPRMAPVKQCQKCQCVYSTGTHICYMRTARPQGVPETATDKRRREAGARNMSERRISRRLGAS